MENFQHHEEAKGAEVTQTRQAARKEEDVKGKL